jgi:hypothetical protein
MGLKLRTVRYIHAILSGAFDDAVKWQRIVINPARRSTPPSASAARPPEAETWSGPQLRRFLELAWRPLLLPAPAFLALTRCRRGEALGLRWIDIDRDRGDSTSSRVQTFAAIRQTVIPLSKPSRTGREGRVMPGTKDGRSRVIELDSPRSRCSELSDNPLRPPTTAAGAQYPCQVVAGSSVKLAVSSPVSPNAQTSPSMTAERLVDVVPWLSVALRVSCP